MTEERTTELLGPLKLHNIVRNIEAWDLSLVVLSKYLKENLSKVGTAKILAAPFFNHKMSQERKNVIEIKSSG